MYLKLCMNSAESQMGDDLPIKKREVEKIQLWKNGIFMTLISAKEADELMREVKENPSSFNGGTWQDNGHYLVWMEAKN